MRLKLKLMKNSKNPLIDFPEQTLWKGKSKDLWEFYCPYCKLKRRLPYRSRPGGVKQVAQVGLTTAFVAVLTWPWFDWKGLVAFVPLWAVYEMIYRSRLRVALLCSNCGFDPYLYLTDIQKARTELEKHLRVKYEKKGIPFPVKPGAPSEKQPQPEQPRAAADGEVEEDFENNPKEAP
jgi:hypothetical protein